MNVTNGKPSGVYENTGLFEARVIDGKYEKAYVLFTVDYRCQVHINSVWRHKEDITNQLSERELTELELVLVPF